MPLLGVNTRAKPLGTVRPPRGSPDISIDRLRIQGDRKVVADVLASTTSLDLQMSIESASTLTLKIRDWHRGLLRSNIPQTRSVVTLDGVEYCLVKVSHDGDELTLIFEELLVNLLRRYDSPKKANRDNTTRAAFIRGMVNEVRERRIPFRCPELTERQRIA